MQYLTFGYIIDSDIALPSTQVNEYTSADIIIRQGVVDEPGGSFISPKLRVAVNGPEVIINVDGVARYKISKGQHITYESLGGEEEDIRPFLISQILAVALVQKGDILLEASAVEKDNHCLIFLGPSGVGKSTLARGFIQKKYKLLSDGMVRVLSTNDNQKAHPGYWQQLLSIASLEALDIAHNKLSFVRDEVYLKILNAKSQEFCHNISHIKTIYLLKEANESKPKLYEIRNAHKFYHLKNHTYGKPYLNGSELAKEHFGRLMDLVKSVPLVQCSFRKNDFQNFKEMVDLLEQDFLKR